MEILALPSPWLTYFFLSAKFKINDMNMQLPIEKKEDVYGLLL
jgi:hypothetical protein